jgi:HD-GYP domain-containing protein (c-di-GMP phosphodiesterase class II)
MKTAAVWRTSAARGNGLFDKGKENDSGMKSIAVNLLKPGMAFSESVYIDTDNIFVPAGVAIKEKDLERLLEWKVESVSTDGTPFFSEEDENADAAPGATADVSSGSEAHNEKNLAEKNAPILSIFDGKEHKSAYRTYISMIERLYILFLRISTQEFHMDNRTISSMAAEVLKMVREQQRRVIAFILSGEITGHEIAKNAVDTAILSALVAMEIRMPNHKIISAVIGALLHDTGMHRLPKSITGKKGELSEAERKIMRSHPLLSQKIVVKEIGYSDEVGNIVLQHHERWDGEGYPLRIAGAKTEISSRIVSIADAFEAMISSKPYRNPMSGYQATKSLLADNSRRFDPTLLKVFISIMGIYPIGSIILLNNGNIAQIVETRATAPLRPRVQILIEANKGRIIEEADGEKKFVDLLMEKGIYISKAMTAKEFSELNA